MTEVGMFTFIEKVLGAGKAWREADSPGGESPSASCWVPPRGSPASLVLSCLEKPERKWKCWGDAFLCVKKRLKMSVLWARC